MIDQKIFDKEMTKLSFRILFWIINNTSKKSNKIILNPKFLAEELKSKSLSKVYGSIKELVSNNLIQKESGHLYKVLFLIPEVKKTQKVQKTIFEKIRILFGSK